MAQVEDKSISPESKYDSAVVSETGHASGREGSHDQTAKVVIVLPAIQRKESSKLDFFFPFLLFHIDWNLFKPLLLFDILTYWVPKCLAHL